MFVEILNAEQNYRDLDALNQLRMRFGLKNLMDSEIQEYVEEPAIKQEFLENEELQQKSKGKSEKLQIIYIFKFQTFHHFLALKSPKTTTRMMNLRKLQPSRF